MPAAPTPSDAFLELVRRSRQGRLKVFLGPAAGVGKTYRMLQEAHQLGSRGVDVAIAMLDAHGRSETAALMAGLPEVAPRRMTYRGVAAVEVDVAEVERRSPEVVLVDEVAHTNAPGSRNRKRYEDVLDLLRAGIHVYCTLNIQHLESLNDVVRQATGVTVRDTVPDAFLRRADQIVNIDLPPDDLLERLRAGKIYPPERVAWALGHLFQPQKLEALRELALREVAEWIGRTQLRPAPEGAPAPVDGQRWTGGRLMLCLSSRSPRAQLLLRRASRMAGRLNVHWYAVYVETPSEASTRLDPRTRQLLSETQQMARDLGAEVHQIRAPDLVAGILEFARANGVTDIIIGVTGRPWLKQALGLTVPQILVRRAYGFDIHLVSAEEPGK